MNGWMRSTQRVLCDSIAASLKRDGTGQAVFPHHSAVDTSMQNGILSGLYGVMVRWMHQKKQANEIRVGNVIETDGGRMVRVIKYTYTQGAGRQLGHVQIEGKDIMGSGAKLPLRFKTKDMVNVVRLEEKRHQFLYEENSVLYFMEPEAFEQVSVSRDLLSDDHKLMLKEGEEAMLEFYDGRPVTVSLPTTVKLTVIEAAPHVKGATAAPQYKPATLETGLKILVPPFIKSGDLVVVDTTTKEFVKRA